MPDDAAKPALRYTDIRWLAEVDSTNLRLAALVREQGDAARNFVVVADHQTAGRGRRGRTWEAPPGSSLLVSAVIGAPAPDLAPLTTVCAALAAADACDQVAGLRPSLKWPNDVMVGGRKLGGILAEAVGPSGGAFDARSASSETLFSAPITTQTAQETPGIAVVVGLGLNVDWGAMPLPDGATALADIPGTPPVDRVALLRSYLEHLGRRGQALHDVEERGRLLDDYRRACCTIGRTVIVDMGHERLEGTATGVTDRGHLILAAPGGRREVAAGDVVHVDSP